MKDKQNYTECLAGDGYSRKLATKFSKNLFLHWGFRINSVNCNMVIYNRGFGFSPIFIIFSKLICTLGLMKKCSNRVLY